MKKILWFSNCMLSNTNNKASGSWLYSMSRLLVSAGNIHLVNITRNRNGGTQNIEHHQLSDKFEEYTLPNWPVNKENLPAKENCEKIAALCKTINPDIIHVWGVENYFSTLVPELGLPQPQLLEIQGLQKPCAEVYYGDLTPSGILSSFGLREVLFPFKKSIFSFRKDMAIKGENECKTIKKYKHISTQSKWIRNQIRLINDSACIYKTGMSLREEFWKADKWKYNTKTKDFYCSAAGPAPYKCIQTAIKALKTVIQFYPETKLYIVGNFINNNWLHQPGYLTYLKKMVKNQGLSNNIIFTGPLNASEIIEVMHKCIGMIQTSYVESYSLAVAEAQAVGVPSIISYAGAMPELAEDYKSGIFFTPGDHLSCASKMMELIENSQLAQEISNNSYKLAKERNNDSIVLEKQIKIYKQIIEQ